MSREAQALKALGKNIKDHRKQSGLTQEQLAELCEFDPTYISLLERGKRNPAFLTVVKIAKHLKCEVSEIADV
ncbi:MAG: helix-turn-helix transcriptional regulator [Micavibrio sp.]|nr:helix-turn-helix transcriptional regulator [Micavibrio sp.]